MKDLVGFQSSVDKALTETQPILQEPVIFERCFVLTQASVDSQMLRKEGASPMLFWIVGEMTPSHMGRPRSQIFIAVQSNLSSSPTTISIFLISIQRLLNRDLNMSMKIA